MVKRQIIALPANKNLLCWLQFCIPKERREYDGRVTEERCFPTRKISKCELEKNKKNLNQEISLQIILCLFVCTFRTVENLCNISIEGTHITVPKLPQLKENILSM